MHARATIELCYGARKLDVGFVCNIVSLCSGELIKNMEVNEIELS